MPRIIAFAGSNSSSSINQIWVRYLSGSISSIDVELIQLTDFDIPMYSIDLENKSGFPLGVQLLLGKLKEADGLLISVNEHNGTVSAFFKNILDWLSRLDRNFLAGKKILLTSTSPGARGASSALAFAKAVLPRFGAEIVESFSLPSFQSNFDREALKMTNESQHLGIMEVLASFEQALSH
ncbi:NADPH-dependent FMN reductase [Croceiramulus getboli]|nr:NAD(P)H-dependent oxidoreductase [Flavobacteriaceae bacterium YJPT1-3]